MEVLLVPHGLRTRERVLGEVADGVLISLDDGLLVFQFLELRWAQVYWVSNSVPARQS